MLDKTHIFDKELHLHDNAAAVTADGAGQVGGSAAILDLGQAFVEGDFVVNKVTLDSTTGDEVYNAILQLSSKPDFADTIVEAARIPLGAAAAPVDVDNYAAGKDFVGFNNKVGGVIYRYARLYLDVAGTTPSFAGEAYITKN